MTPHNPNPGNFSHGDLLPIKGGRHHGKYHTVSFLFHGIHGLEALATIPSSGLKIGDEFYVLDHKRRAWVYAPQKRKGPSHLYRANRKRRVRRG